MSDIYLLFLNLNLYLKISASYFCCLNVFSNSTPATCIKGYIIIVIIVLYIISINNILIKDNISILTPKLIILIKYIPISYIIVVLATISISVILLSLEKLLSKYSPNSPTIPSIIAVCPNIFPFIMSMYNPNIIPKANPIFLPIKSPINNMNIINKFGEIPYILNQLNKFICKNILQKNYCYSYN